MKTSISDNKLAQSKLAQVQDLDEKFDKFIKTYHPNRWADYCKPENLPRLYTGKAPTIGTIRRNDGCDFIASVVKAHLYHLIETCGCRDKVDTNQITMLIPNLITKYGHIKITEFMHFCYLFVNGEYGHFYGKIDPIVITESLLKFDMGVRRDLFDRYHKEAEREKKRQEDQYWDERRKRYAARIPGAWTPDALMTFDQYNRTHIDDLSDEEAAREVKLYVDGSKEVPKDPRGPVDGVYAQFGANRQSPSR